MLRCCSRCKLYCGILHIWLAQSYVLLCYKTKSVYVFYSAIYKATIYSVPRELYKHSFSKQSWCSGTEENQKGHSPARATISLAVNPLFEKEDRSPLVPLRSEDGDGMSEFAVLKLALVESRLPSCTLHVGPPSCRKWNSKVQLRVCDIRLLLLNH